MGELSDYTVDDLKEAAAYLRLQQLKAVDPDYERLSATAKVRVMQELQRRKGVPQPPDTMGEALRIQRERGQR